jgi:DNA repair protein RadC
MTKRPISPDGDFAPSADERTFFPQLQLDNSPAAKKAPAPEAHYHGHRDRLRARYRESGDAALADYEILEMLLFRLIARSPVSSAPRSRCCRR